MRQVPKLLVGSVAVLPPDSATSGLAEWETNEGIVVRGYRSGGYGWIAAPGVANYRFSDVGAVVACPDGGEQSRIEAVWLSSILPLVVQARGTQVLHASAICASDRIVALCGVSGAGKSTLAGAMARRGHPIAADDALLPEMTPDGPIGAPLPFSLRLRPPAAAFFGSEERSSPRRCADPEPLAALVLLEPDPDAGIEVALEALNDPGALVGSLLPQLYCFSLEDGKQDLVRDLFALVNAVPVFRLVYRQKFDDLPAVCEVLEGLMRA